MNVVLLSGGSGKRLWPLSNDIRSKQFIKIFRTNQGYESMVQRIYRQIKKADENATVTITTSKTQVSAIRNQLGEAVSISVEPCRRDTFPAIALAAAYLIDVKKMNPQEAIIVCPVDPYVEDDYFTALKKMLQEAEKNGEGLILLGIEPSYPSEKYGYIIPDSKKELAGVLNFKEKPDMDNAKDLIAQGALWNGGVFACQLKYILKKTKELLGDMDYYTLLSQYRELEKISFDYAVVEKEKNIKVMKFMGSWKDLGTWNTLTEAMEENVFGDARLDERCRNTHVINELSIPILAMGMENVVISASSEGILVSDKERSSYIKPFVEKMESKVMFAEKSWGSFRVLDVSDRSMTMKVVLNSGHKMNYHSHERRDEVWIIVNGRGSVILDGQKREVKAGDIVNMPLGCRHTILAETELQVIEVQTGDEISVHDKRKHVLEIQ